ncbi:cation:proton antiporter domain-containing protein [Lachnoclostridium phytofermentans]|uniref:Sodium/hydrogen exchanger n=1 Tax=Lachnoclostridium phytofermentans (strain ATCC 700394 / DSM 18823 / ISDg) TaxID=357809 RepID=A9KQY8_LACP7|nr:cation:proton antiporter [Lachnoclostridium phytofermentans]ABX43467.1 sodium/hydrogen exchanger [Lachnoclostridium phytofermentans ISDg]
MLISLALIFLLSLLLGGLAQKLKLPSLIGILLAGMILSPYALNLLDGSILTISPDLRKLALVIILTRAGLSLDLKSLKKVGRPAILMCFVPASLEIIGVVLLAPALLKISILEAAIIGAVIAAVSPAVVVPRMLRIMEEGRGKKHSIPELILAGASVDDVYVIVLFTAFTSLAGGEGVSVFAFVGIPVSIVLGILFGVITGIILNWFFRKFHYRDSVKILILLSISFLLLELETRMQEFLPMSGLLAIMSLGITLYQTYPILSERLSAKYNKLWVAAEIVLFALVGASVDLSYAVKAGGVVILLVLGALCFRMLGVLLCLIKTLLTRKERVFCMLAYTPKATVQAAIGAIPLSMGLPCGETVLTVAVISILITAPMGAIFIDRFYRKLLT